MRRPTTSTRFPLQLAAALLCVGLSGRAAADSVRTESASGFGRIVFTLTPLARAKTVLAGGVLTVSFDRKIAVDPAAVVQGLPAYIANGRADPDGSVFRFALVQDVHLHISTSANQVGIDLAPENFVGTPPDLPPPPPKEPQAVDVQKLPVLRIRAGAYAGFSRLVFDWPRSVAYAVFPGAGKITIRFEALARPDFTAFEHVSPPWVKEAGWKAEGGGTVIEFDTDTQSGYHDFRDGSNVVLDILKPKADAATYKPPSDLGAEISRPELVKLAQAAKADDANPQSKAIAAAAAKLNPPPKTKPVAPAAKPVAAPPPPAQAAATPVASPAPSQVTGAPGQSTAPGAAASGPAPPATNADTAATQTLRTHEGIVISFAGVGAQSAAVFVRGMTAWIVIDGAPLIDPVQLKAALGDFPASLEEASNNNVTTVRIGLKQPEQIVAHAMGTNLAVELSPHAQQSPIAIGFVRTDDDPKHTALGTLVPGATHAVIETDPVAGDTLIIVPGVLGRAVLDPRNYAEFAILPTAAGLAIQPYTDDLVTRVNWGM